MFPNFRLPGTTLGAPDASFRQNEAFGTCALAQAPDVKSRIQGVRLLPVMDPGH
jgi:hypothetical protein